MAYQLGLRHNAPDLERRYQKNGGLFSCLGVLDRVAERFPPNHWP